MVARTVPTPEPSSPPTKMAKLTCLAIYKSAVHAGDQSPSTISLNQAASFYAVLGLLRVRTVSGDEMSRVQNLCAAINDGKRLSGSA